MIEVTSLDYLKRNLDILKQRIEKASRKASRNPADIKLVAVTKNVDIDKIHRLGVLGITDFGENRVPELVRKSGIIGGSLSGASLNAPTGDRLSVGRPVGGELLPPIVGHASGHATGRFAVANRSAVADCNSPDVTSGSNSRTINLPVNHVRKIDNTGKTDNHSERLNDTRLSNGVNWHMIGHLQTNKVRKGLQSFGYLHSLDSLHLAEMLEKDAAQLNKRLSVFIEVNVSGEETKSGIKPEEAKEFYTKISGFVHLNIIGLMTMAPEVRDVEIIRPVFSKLRELLDDLRIGLTEDEKTRFNHLSMGMSNDFEVAIEEGATFLRIGTALFKP